MDSKQTSIFKPTYADGDFVCFIALTFDRHNNPKTRMAHGQIESGANGRSDWYYVREQSGEVHLMRWSDLTTVTD